MSTDDSKTDETTPRQTTKPLPKTKASNHYVDKAELLTEVVASRERGEMTRRLAEMLLSICVNYSNKSHFVNYSYKDDMQSYAMMMLVKTWKSFDPDRGTSPFAFYTQCVHHSFMQFINKEKKHQNIRDKMLVEYGMNPSFSYQIESEGNDYHVVDDEEDFGTFVIGNDPTTVNSEDVGEDSTMGGNEANSDNSELPTDEDSDEDKEQ